MNRDPDALETSNAERPTQGPATDFLTAPSRAERAMPGSQEGQPLWPWLVVLGMVAAVVLVYFAVS
jgi:hypothetical protein